MGYVAQPLGGDDDAATLRMLFAKSWSHLLGRAFGLS